MSPITITLIAGVAFQFASFAVSMRAWFPHDREAIDISIDVSAAVAQVIFTIGILAFTEQQWLSVFSAGCAGYYAWCAWRTWRRRRKGKPSRVLGVVRDLGHRLTVVPVPGGAR